MSEPITRRSIGLRKSPHDYYDVLETLGFEYEPVIACPRWPNFKNTGAKLHHCAAFCSYKCGRFMSFQWVIDQCANPYCEIDEPCRKCMDKIKKVKVLVSVAIVTHFRHGNSIGAIARHICETE